MHKLNGEVGQLVQEVLDSLSEPWGENVTDRVCMAIERNSYWLECYNQLVTEHGKHAVNSQIGHSTLQLTDLRNLGTHQEAKSSLIKTYTRLGR